MHIVSVVTDGDGYRAQCNCGWTSNRYGTESMAWNMAYNHKDLREANPSDSGNSNDDPRVGF